VHCALGLSLLRLLPLPSIWTGSAWASSPLTEAGVPRPTAPGGGARSIPVNRRRGEAGKLTRSKLASRGARFWGQKGGVLTGVGLLTASAVERPSLTAAAWSVGRWRLLMSRRGAVRRWGPHGVVAGLEEDRRQRCAWRRSRQLGQRGAVGDRPEERSMAPIDGSAGNMVVGLECGVTERRGAAVDSAVAVRGCTDGGMKKGGELRCMASEGDTTGCMLGMWRQQRHAAPASGALARSG
jgi:hypothetical protein